MKIARFARRAAGRQARRSALKGLLRRTLLAEQLEVRSLMAADIGFASNFWNAALPTDVNGDGSTAPIDAVLIINSLNNTGARALPQGTAGEGPQAASTPTFYDVNNDGFVSSIDAVLVINKLNGEGEGPNGEKVQYEVRVLEAGTNNPITTIEAGQEYDLQVVVSDLRTIVPPNRGVAAAYLDILYNKSLTSVRVHEIQNVTISRGSSRTGTFTLTLNGQTTAPINNSSSGATIANNIAQALGALPIVGGAQNVLVTAAGGDNLIANVRFIGRFDVDFDAITGNVSGIPTGVGVTSTEIVKGNPLDPDSFTEAFKTRSYPGLEGSPTSFTDTLFAEDLPDRINDVGALSQVPANPPEVASEPVEVVRARMLAKAPGTLTFTPSVEDMIRPAHDTVVFANTGAPLNESSEVAVDEILLRPGPTLTITAPALLAVADTANVAENSTTGVLINVLQNDTTTVSGGVIQLRSVGSAGAAGTTSIDNNGTPTNTADDRVRFIPAAGFTGTANFTYVIGLAGNTTTTATGSVAVTVGPVNDPPVNSVPGAQTVTEGGSRIFNAGNSNLISISDPDAGTNPVQVTLTGNNGTISLSGIAGLTFTTGDGTGDTTMTFTGTIAAINAALNGLSFTPPANFPPGATGNASLVITTNDQGSVEGPAQSDTDTIAITVNGVNDAPIVTLPAGPLSVASVATLPITTTTVTDEDAGTAVIRTTIAVTSPSGNPGTLTLGSTTGLTFTTGDGSGDATMTFTGTQAATDAAIKTLVFTPTDIVTVTLTVTVNDQGNSGTGGPLQGTDSVIIDVIPPALPFARSDSRTIDEGSTTPVIIDVLSRVLVNPGEQAVLDSITPIAQTGLGSVAINYGPGQDVDNNTILTDDTVTYTPPGGEVSGAATFTYTANETDNDGTPGNGPTTNTVTIIIRALNDPPVAVNDTFQATINTPANIPAPGVLGNDTDPENDPLSAVLVAGPASGTLSLSANGGFTYTPPTGFGGDVSFTYRANDGTDNSLNVATVTIHVAAPPVAANDTFTADEDATLTVPARGVLTNDTDPSENRVEFLTAVLGTGPARGTLTLNADGGFTYRGNQDFSGSDSFTYRATDAGRDSNLATVTIAVNEVNDNPTANPDTFQAVKRNGAVGVDQIVPVLGNDSSAPDVGETLTVTAVNGGVGPSPTTAGGSVRLQGGQILYTSPTTTGQDTFTYTISDGRGGTATATVTVTVVDFVPKDVRGTVYLDNDNDGVIDSGDQPLGGIEVQLSGTDFTNTAVALSVLTDATGAYNFAGLRPGNYTVQQVQPLYLLDGIETEASALATVPAGSNDRFAISWQATDQSGAITGLNFAERGVNLNSLVDSRGVIQELFASSQPQDGFWIASDLSGSSRWSFTLNGWENASSMSFDIGSNLTSGILTVKDGNGTTYTRTLHLNPANNTGVMAGSDARFRILGRAANGDLIIRIDATAAECGLNLLAATVAPASVPQGEGEAAEFAGAADEVFANAAWA